MDDEDKCGDDGRDFEDNVDSNYDDKVEDIDDNDKDVDDSIATHDYAFTELSATSTLHS
jgi:hypothetical protein